jgi:hypothetical protein
MQTMRMELLMESPHGHLSFVNLTELIDKPLAQALLTPAP